MKLVCSVTGMALPRLVGSYFVFRIFFVCSFVRSSLIMNFISYWLNGALSRLFFAQENAFVLIISFELKHNKQTYNELLTYIQMTNDE